MNSSKKYLKKLLSLFVLPIFIFSTPQAIYTMIDNQIDEQVLGNMMENLYANMTPAEQEAFAQEIEFQQQKIMQMSPEERDNYEKMMLSELDQLMATTPELFEKPKKASLIDQASAKTIEHSIAEKEVSEDLPAMANSTTSKPKPKEITIPQELKDQSRKNMRQISQAIDTILLKTNQMHDITHASWNKGRWLNLKNDLQNLKTYLPMAVNSNKVLAELLNKSQQPLVHNLKDFEQLVTHLASELKTPDAMGLITFYEGKPQIIDPSRYEQAVIKLKEIADKLTHQLGQTKLLEQIKSLLDKHAPEQLKSVCKKPKKSTANQPKPILPSCLELDQATVKNQAQELILQINKTANQSLLELLVQYQNIPSANLKRKLQWKLSELELYLERLVKLTNTSTRLNCLNELTVILTAFDYATLDEIILTLKLINSNDLNSELLNLYSQLRILINLPKQFN